MSFGKFGRTLIFLFAVVIFMIGTVKGLRIVSPQIRKVSPSLADAIQL